MAASVKLSDGASVVAYQTSSGVEFDLIGASALQGGGDVNDPTTRLGLEVTSTVSPWVGIESLSSGGFTIEWVENGSVMAQDFDATGAATDQAHSLNRAPMEAHAAFASGANGGFTSGVSAISETTYFSSKGYVTETVTYPTTSPQLSVQLHNPDGTTSSPFVYTGAASSFITEPGVVQLADGEYLATFVTGDNSQASIHVERFSSAGVDEGGSTPFTMASGYSSFTGGALSNYTAAGLPDGGYVIVLTTHDQAHTGSAEVLVQEYDAAGGAWGPAKAIGVTSQTERPTIDALANGAYVVSWHNASDGALVSSSFFEQGGAENALNPPPSVPSLSGEGTTGLRTGGNSQTPTSDGGFVRVTEATQGSYDPQLGTIRQGDLLIQKFDSNGTQVGPTAHTGPAYYAVSTGPDGGYVLALQGYSMGAGGYFGVESFSAQGQQVGAGGDISGEIVSVTATPGGGSLVAYTLDGNQTTPGQFDTTRYQLLDSSGHVVGDPVEFAGAVQSSTADALGDVSVVWTDFGTDRTFVFNPNDTSDTVTTTPAIQVDDQSGAAIAWNGTTNDATPTLRVNVSAVGEIHAGVQPYAYPYSPAPGAGTVVQVTQADVNRGYVDIPLSVSGDGQYEAFARFVDSAGAAGAFRETVFNVSGSGSSGGSEGRTYTTTGNGQTLVGGSGDDTFIVNAPGLDTMTGGAGADTFKFNPQSWGLSTITDFTVGTDKLDLSAYFSQYGYTGSDPIADGWVFLVSDGAGGTDVRFLDHTGASQYPSTIIDLQGVSPNGLTWAELLGAGSGGGGGQGQTLTMTSNGQVLVGGSGDDTFIVSAPGLDTMTGGGGSDTFHFNPQSWGLSTITDFTLGTDKLDLSAYFSLYGYTGTDPVADGWVFLVSDGNGGTDVRFLDHTGASQYPATIIDLQGVSPSGLTWAQLSGGGGSSAGQTFTMTGNGQVLVGGSGDDSFTVSAPGLDTMTGGGGSDTFHFIPQSWGLSTITDFTPGTDKIDLSAYDAKYGYTGTDPISDGWVYLVSDGSGGTDIRYLDHTGASPYPATIIDLQGVAPSQVHLSDFILH